MAKYDQPPEMKEGRRRKGRDRNKGRGGRGRGEQEITLVTL